MSGYNNNDTYGTSGTTGGLGVSKPIISIEEQLRDKKLTRS